MGSKHGKIVRHEHKALGIKSDRREHKDLTQGRHAVRKGGLNLKSVVKLNLFLAVRSKSEHQLQALGTESDGHNRNSVLVIVTLTSVGP